MIDYSPFNEYTNSEPANSYHQILSHPIAENGVIELGLFNHHRFAFYYWAKWKLEFLKNRKTYNLDLISFDWHQDLVYPCDYHKSNLSKIDLENLFEVSFYSSYKLNPLNHDHIMSAVYLDLINDVWVLCKQGTFEDEYLIDCKGKKHTIRKFKTEQELKKALFKSNIENVFFDIDLDYFTITNNLEVEKKISYMKDKDIKEAVSLDNELIKWIFNRVNGITLALEPEYTGGISKSLKYLSIIEKSWFNKSLGNWNVSWKHKKENE